MSGNNYYHQSYSSVSLCCTTLTTRLPIALVGLAIIRVLTSAAAASGTRGRACSSTFPALYGEHVAHRSAIHALADAKDDCDLQLGIQRPAN
mgnify:CR=1 FL=1